MYLYKYFCSILPVIHMYCNSFEKRFIPHRMKQCKHMDLDGCLSNIFPYLPMFLIFLASSFCWKRYFFQQPKKAPPRNLPFSAIIEVIYVLKEGSCCEQGTHQELMEKLLGTTSRNRVTRLSPQKLRCAVFSLEVRF